MCAHPDHDAQIYMSHEEVAERWRVTVRTTRRLFKEGVLKGMRVGREVRITRESVLAYEAAQGGTK